MVPTSPAAVSVFAPGTMQGRHALITGGGSGVGRATAHLLAGLGAHVTVVDDDQNPLAETAEFAPDLISTATADPVNPSRSTRCSPGVDACDFPAQQRRPDSSWHRHRDITTTDSRAVTRPQPRRPWYLTTAVAASSSPANYGKIVSITMTRTGDAAHGPLVGGEAAWSH